MMCRQDSRPWRRMSSLLIDGLAFPFQKGINNMEEWKDIPGYEGLYQASTLGRVRTCEGKVTSSARFPHRVWKQRILKQKVTKNRKGRYDSRIDLWNGKTHRTWLVSRLIAITWCSGYREGWTVNHIN